VDVSSTRDEGALALDQDPKNPLSRAPMTPEAVHLKKLLEAFRQKYDEVEGLTGQKEQFSSEAELKEELEALKMQQKRLLEINFELQSKLQGALASSDNKESASEELRLSYLRVEKLAELLKEKEQKLVECHHFEVIAKKAQEMKIGFERQLEDLEGKKIKLEAELSALKNAALEQKQHSEQLERAIQFLRGRLEESHLEANQFKEDYQKSQELIKRLQEEKESHLKKSGQLELSLARSLSAKTELEEELGLVHAQFEQLKNTVIKLQNGNASLETDLKKEREEGLGLKIQTGELSAKIVEKDKAFQVLEDEVNTIRQALIRGLKEIKELEEHQQIAVAEKNNAINRIHQLQRQIEKGIEKEESLRVQLYDLEQKMNIKEAEFLEEKKAKEQELWKQIEGLQEQLEKQQFLLEEKALEFSKKSEEWGQSISLQRHQFETHLQKMQEHQREEVRRFQERLSAYAAVETEKNELLSEVDRLNAAVSHLQKSLQDSQNETKEIEEKLSRRLEEKVDEKENELKVSHQHLAKKVKETTILSERNEALVQELGETKKTVDLQAAKIDHLEQAIKLEGEHQKRIQDQLIESVKMTEEKLFRMEEKLLETKERLKKEQMHALELEKLAEKHQQIQNALSNLGFLSKESALPSLRRSEETVKKQSVKAEEREVLSDPEAAETVKPEPKPFNNLFELPKQSPKPKLNLFD